MNSTYRFTYSEAKQEIILVKWAKKVTSNQNRIVRPGRRQCECTKCTFVLGEQSCNCTGREMSSKSAVIGSTISQQQKIADKRSSEYLSYFCLWQVLCCRWILSLVLLSVPTRCTKSKTVQGAWCVAEMTEALSCNEQKVYSAALPCTVEEAKW